MLAVLAGLFGLLIGSFLNVVVWRLPRGESLSAPGSHCPACGHPIRFYDNIPVLSWLILRGRCRDCGAPISIRYPLVELATGVAFGVTAAFVGPTVFLPCLLWFVAAAIALALIDIEHKRLPNALTMSTYAVVLVGVVAQGAVSGEWGDSLRAVAAGLALGLFYGLLATFVPAGMGWGDAKLALSLGTVLGTLSWAAVIVGTFAAFVLGAVVGVLGMVFAGMGRRSAIPFGPFMLAGALVAVPLSSPLAAWYAALLQ